MSTQRIVKISTVLLFIMLVGLAFGEGVISSPTNIARGQSYTIFPGAAYSLTRDEGDRIQLTDGAYDAGDFHIWRRKTTVGWYDRLIHRVVIDLGKVEPVSGVSFSSAAGDSATWPFLMGIFVSDDNVSWHEAGDLLALSAEENGEPRVTGKHRFTTSKLKTYGRYVAFEIWTDPFLFSDEIEVYRGSKECLQYSRGEVVLNVRALMTERATIVLVRRHMETDFDQLRSRIQQTSLSDSRKAELKRELDIVQSDPNLVDGMMITSRFIIPYTDLHAKGLALYADVRQADGEPSLCVWGAKRWDPLLPTDTCSSNAPKAVVDVAMMKNEVRSAVFNITNGERTPKNLKIVYQGAGAPEAGWLTIQEVAWTRLRRGNDPNGSALPAVPVVYGVPTVSVPGGLTRQLWLTIDSKKLPVGVTEGTLAVFDGDEQVGTVPLRVSVADVAMPEELSLGLGGWEYSDSKTGWGIRANNRTNAVAFLKRYHVTEPWASPGVMAFGKHDKTTGAMLTPPNTAVLDAWLDLWPNARHYGVFTHQPEDLPDTPAAKRRIAEWITFWVDHLEAHGISPEQLTLQFVDEPNSSEKDRRVIGYARAVKAAQPKVQIFTNPIWADLSEADPELFAVADRICIHRPRTIKYRDKQEKFVSNLDKAEKQVGFYSCHMRAQVMDPYAYYLLQAWDCFRRGMTYTRFWSFASSGGGAASSWRAPVGRWWCATPQFLDKNGCTTAKHMEAIRESLYDYEYMVILRDRAEVAKKAGGKAEAVARAEAVLKSGPERILTANGVDELYWSKPKDRSVADTVRLEVLALIEELEPGGKQ